MLRILFKNLHEDWHEQTVTNSKENVEHALICTARTSIKSVMFWISVIYYMSTVNLNVCVCVCASQHMDSYCACIHSFSVHSLAVFVDVCGSFSSRASRET